jgi:hypothetical protein
MNRPLRLQPTESEGERVSVAGPGVGREDRTLSRPVGNREPVRLGLSPADPGMLVLVAVEQDTHNYGGETDEETFEELVPAGKIKRLGAVEDPDDGVAAVPQVVLHHLIHQPGGLSGGGSLLVPKLKAITMEHVTPQLEDCLLEQFQDQRATSYRST